MGYNCASSSLMERKIKPIILQDERLHFLQVLYEAALKSRGDYIGSPYKELKANDLSNKTSLSGQKFGAILSCLRELGYIKTFDAGKHLRISITSEGMIYYEDLVSEVERRKRERKMEWLRMLLPALVASVLTLTIQHFINSIPQSSSQTHVTKSTFQKPTLNEASDRMQKTQIQPTRSDSSDRQ